MEKEIEHTLWYIELCDNHIALFRLLSEIQKGHAIITHVSSAHITIKAQKYIIDKIRGGWEQNG